MTTVSGPYRAKYRVLLACALVAHLAAAWFNVGYLHPDEHYQILEFANYRLDPVENVDLPWEYETRIRSALQPVVAMAAIHSLGAVGVESPFHVAFVLRLVSALLGLLVAVGMWHLSARWLTDQGWLRVAALLTLLFWAMPMLHARFSSENWSGIFMFGGLILLLLPDRDEKSSSMWRASASGLFLGLAFWFRFQVGLSLVGLALWLLVVERPPARMLVGLVIGAVAALAAGFLVDAWFYGDWVLTPWNYLRVNLVEGRAATFGTEPWWWYLGMLLLQLVPPVSLVLVASGLVAVVTRRRNVLVWILVPFLLIHSIIGHKEIRFLYPLIYLLPAICVLALDGAGSKWAFMMRRWRSIAAARQVAFAWLGLNVAVMVVVCLLPSNHSAVIQKWLYDTSREQAITVYTLDRDPCIGARYRMNFYATDRVEVRRLIGEAELDSVVRAAAAPVFLFHDQTRMPALVRSGQIEVETRCRSLPAWIEDLPLVRSVFTLKVWAIYACRPGQATPARPPIDSSDVRTAP